MKDILLVGGGGHCKSVIDSLWKSEKYKIAGIIDPQSCKISEIPWIGTDNDLPMLFSKGISYAFITVGSIGDTKIRQKLYNQLRKIGFKLPNIIDKTAILSKKIKLGEGNFFGKNVVVNAGSTIKNMAIINTNTTIEHDCIIEDFVHLSSGTILCGGVSVNAQTHIGAGTVIIQGLTIGKNTIIGAGSVVVNDIRDGVKAFGNPCRIVGE